MVSAFPQFGDGNVEIYLSSNSSDRLVLHSYVLALHSTWFKASLSERWNEGSVQPGSGNGTNRWTYELRFDKDSAFGLLTRRAESGQPQPTDTEFIDATVDVSGRTNKTKMLHKDRLATIKAHEQLLGMVYHLQSAFSQESFQGSKAMIRLVETAEAYGAENVIKMPIESHVRFHKDEILALCATSSVDMLNLAVTVQSQWIFTEAAMILIGASNSTFAHNVKRLAELKVLLLLQLKRNEFIDRLKSADLSLFRIQATPTTARGLDATSYYRNWLAEQSQAGYGSGLCQGYAKLYRQIQASASNPSGPTDIRTIQKWLDRTYKGKAEAKDFSEVLSGVFSKAVKVVEPLLESSSKQDNSTKVGDQPLRFIGISREELPWIAKG